MSTTEAIKLPCRKCGEVDYHSRVRCGFVPGDAVSGVAFPVLDSERVANEAVGCRECKEVNRHLQTCNLNVPGNLCDRSFVLPPERSPAPSVGTEARCWFCDYETLREPREKTMLLVVVAGMPQPSDALCDKHREGWNHMQSIYRKATR